MKWAIIGIDQYNNRRRICVEDSMAKAIDFINSQRVDNTFISVGGYKSNFNHYHILRGYVDAIIEPFIE